MLLLISGKRRRNQFETEVKTLQESKAKKVEKRKEHGSGSSCSSSATSSSWSVEIVRKKATDPATKERSIISDDNQVSEDQARNVMFTPATKR